MNKFVLIPHEEYIRFKDYFVKNKLKMKIMRQLGIMLIFKLFLLLTRAIKFLLKY